MQVQSFTRSQGTVDATKNSKGFETPLSAREQPSTPFDLFSWVYRNVRNDLKDNTKRLSEIEFVNSNKTNDFGEIPEAEDSEQDRGKTRKNSLEFYINHNNQISEIDEAAQSELSASPVLLPSSLVEAQYSSMPTVEYRSVLSEVIKKNSDIVHNISSPRELAKFDDINFDFKLQNYSQLENISDILNGSFRSNGEETVPLEERIETLDHDTVTRERQNRFQEMVPPSISKDGLTPLIPADYRPKIKSHRNMLSHVWDVGGSNPSAGIEAGARTSDPQDPSSVQSFELHRDRRKVSPLVGSSVPSMGLGMSNATFNGSESMQGAGVHGVHEGYLSQSEKAADGNVAKHDKGLVNSNIVLAPERGFRRFFEQGFTSATVLGPSSDLKPGRDEPAVLSSVPPLRSHLAQTAYGSDGEHERFGRSRAPLAGITPVVFSKQDGPSLNQDHSPEWMGEGEDGGIAWKYQHNDPLNKPQLMSVRQGEDRSSTPSRLIVHEPSPRVEVQSLQVSVRSVETRENELLLRTNDENLLETMSKNQGELERDLRRSGQDNYHTSFGFTDHEDTSNAAHTGKAVEQESILQADQDEMWGLGTNQSLDVRI